MGIGGDEIETGAVITLVLFVCLWQTDSLRWPGLGQ
jgi:hypothetical protein